MSGAVLELAGAVVGEALRSFLRTALGMLALAMVLSGVAFLIAFDGSWLRGGLAVALTLVDATVVGAILSAKRAVLGGLARGLQQQRLGQRAALALFSPDGPLGHAAERIPVAEAERRLRAAVDSMLGAAARQRGMRAAFARGIQTRLVELIQEVTLARFRADAIVHHGGVDLAKVCAEIGERADLLLFDQVRGLTNRLTATLVLAASGAAVLVALALRQWHP